MRLSPATVRTPSARDTWSSLRVTIQMIAWGIDHHGDDKVPSDLCSLSGSIRPRFEMPKVKRLMCEAQLGGKMAQPSSSSTARRQFGGPMGLGGRSWCASGYVRDWRSRSKACSTASRSTRARRWTWRC